MDQNTAETQWRRLRVDDARVGLLGRQARWCGYTEVVEGVVENIRFDTCKSFTPGEAPGVLLGAVEVQLLDRWYLITDVWVRGGEAADPTEALRDKVHAQGQEIRDLREQVKALKVDTWDDLRDVPASVVIVRDSYGVRVFREGRRWVRHNFHSKVVRRSESKEYGPYTARRRVV